MGKVFTSMTYGMLNPQKAVAFCRTDECGAEILFIGTVRNNNDGRAVTAVTYDGHVALGNNTLNELCADTQSKWGHDLNLWVEHRLGTLKVTEESLLIHVSSPHRDAAYQASRYLIEQIKLRLPVWKEEIYVEGDKSWLAGQTLQSV